MSAPLAFGDMVRVVEAEETTDRGIAGGVGMVVGVRFGAVDAAVVGGGALDEAALVSLQEPVEETVVIARRLLEPTGEVGGFEVVDGLADAGSEYEDVASASRVRVRSTPETDALGLTGLVGEVMGETVPSSSGVDDILGGVGAGYAINAWFEEKGEQYWLHPDILEAVDE